MPIKTEIDCPVDLVTVNENRVRLVALQVLALGILFLITNWWGIVAFLVVDFLLRSFSLGKVSPLFIAAGGLIKLFNIGVKPTDQAPKRFAARMGLAFTSAILVLHFLQLGIVVIVFAAALCFFAFLESVLAICVGCYVYSYSRRIFG